MHRVSTGMARKKALLAAVAMTLGPGIGSGCSFVFVKGPPVDHESRRYFACTSEAPVGLLPAGDAIAGVFLAASAMAATQDRSADQADTLTAMAVAGGLLASAFYGLAGVRRCQDAQAARQLRWLTSESGGVSSPSSSGAQQAGGTPDPWLAPGAPPRQTRTQPPDALPETDAPGDAGPEGGGQ